MCDRDCFHCPFPDCIEDGMTLEDYRESAELDRSLYLQGRSEQERKIAAKQKAYREANREELAAMGRALQRCRKATGLSQARLGECLGVSRQQVCHFEAGRQRIAPEKYLAALSELSGMSVDSLLQEEETIYESLQSYR